MKAPKITSSLLGLLLGASVLAAPLAACARQPENPVPSASEDTKAAKTVTGKVDAKSDSSLSVGGRELKLTATTTYTKSGAPASSADVKVGDRVTVTVADDGVTALAVDVATD
ncbi:MAG TPA: DUF5666 domain-containing protein [Opitutaceae bacterium]|nr:DUF5666 domain-containing protein [Opitutaceae bacterium]HND62791.1 DUF5666 domain-containing protein [Opitutaceae bacterium]